MISYDLSMKCRVWNQLLMYLSISPTEEQMLEATLKATPDRPAPEVPWTVWPTDPAFCAKPTRPNSGY